ncbi:MAG: hypothetical protein M1832_002136 [Thelocarpon impressellum]|nr:MAG: hypothetical protein M1832_002136 [Thelocarpon impressellum]
MSFRPIHPAQSSPSAAGSDASKAAAIRPGDRKGPPPSRRTRNTPKDVTANACIQCKKARTKCDGKQPCFRCFQRNEGATCEYRVHVKMAKEEILERFNLLAEQYRWAHRIMKALISDNHAPGIVERLKRGEDYGSVARSFQNMPLAALDHPSSAASSSFENQGGSSSQSMDYEIEGISEGFSSTSFHGTEDEGGSGAGAGGGSTWTRVTGDADLVSHLLELYFTWVHPVHMVLSEPHFRTSYNGHDGAYCSPALVNVICAMACHLLESPPEEESDWDAMLAEGVGDKFMDEGRSLIKPEDHNRLTTIQAFAIMFLADAGAGKALKASSYIRFASGSLVDAGLQYETHRDAWQITLWGVHSLNVAWNEFTYERSDSPRLLNHNVLDGVRLDREDGQWRQYRQVEDLQTPTQPSLSLLATFESTRFLQIVQDTNALFYDNLASVISARALLTQYRRYLAWREELPGPLATLEPGERPLPHVIFLHVHYHTAMVSLFRPLVGLGHFSRGGNADPEAFALQSAQDGLRLLEQYRAQYTCRYQPQLQILCLLHICDFLVRFGGPGQAQSAAVFCLESLRESRAGFAVCGPLQEMFRRTLVECGIALTNELGDLAGADTFCLDEMMDACTRLSYTQPIEQVRRRLAPTLAEEWEKELMKLGNASPGSMSSGSSGRRKDGDNEKLMQIRSILNG